MNSLKFIDGELEKYSTHDLKELWLEIFQTPPPPFARREFLLNNLQYQQDCQQNGQLKPKTKKILARYYQEFRKNPDFRPTGSRILKPGTRLVREWQGEAHTVTVSASGFEYKGTLYKSLSAIARLITGTQWSGPAFFGLSGGHSAQ